MSDFEGRSRVTLPRAARGAATCRAALLGLALVASGCAHGPGTTRGDAHEASVRRRPAKLPRVARPRDQRTARQMLEQAFALARTGEPARSAALFDAVLSSDFLTDKGRANIYWVSASMHRRLDDPEGEAAALGGFLVAADLLPDAEELEPRRLIARAVLNAHRVQTHPLVGRTPEAAIVVEDVREPASIMASLTCGEDGAARYIDVAIESAQPAAGSRLLRRRARCQESGAVLDLWFDLTYAEVADEPREEVSRSRE